MQFKPFIRRFERANQKYPNLHHAVVRGSAFQKDQDLCGEMMLAIAGDEPLHLGGGLRSRYFDDEGSFHFFYGDVKGLDLLHSLSEAVFQVGWEAGLWEGNKPTMPIPWGFCAHGESAVHDWVDWIRALPNTPCQTSRLLEWKSNGEKCPAGDYLMLPSGDPVGRFVCEGKLIEQPWFKRLLKAQRSGKIGEISIMESSVFLWSAEVVRHLDSLSKPTESTGLENKADAKGPPGNTHTDDYKSAYWNGVTYHFNRSQARAVEMLWDAWQKGGLSVEQKRIGQKLDSANPDYRLPNLFRGHPALGTMIVKAPTSGAFMLSDAKPESRKNLGMRNGMRTANLIQSGRGKRKPNKSRQPA